MQQFEILGKAAFTYPKPTGVINIIRPDGTQPAPLGFDGGGGIDIPWGLNIDGNDDVWVGNFGRYPLGRSVVLMAGVDTKGHAAGHQDRATSSTSSRAAASRCSPMWPSMRPATCGRPTTGTIPDRGTSGDPDRATSTWGGGSGITVIYGVAAPVKPPRMGVVQGY